MNPLVRLYRAALNVFAPNVRRSPDVATRRRPDRSRDRELEPGVASFDRTFEEVRRIIAGHEHGQFHASAVLADAMDRNPRIWGALQNRTLGVTGSPFSILPGLGDRRRAASVAKALEEDWGVMVDESTLAEILRAVVTTGFCWCRVEVLTLNGRWVPMLRPWHGAHCRWDWYSETWRIQTADRGEITPQPGDGWVLFAAGRHRPWMRGVVRCLGLPAETRGYAVRDWARFCEKHGLPIVELKVPATKAESPETDAWFARMENLGTDATIVSPQGEEGQASYGVNLIEAKDTAWKAFEGLIGRQDGDVSIAIEGQNLATENTGAGTYASAKVGHQVRQDLREADAYLLAAVIHEQLLRPWALWNFGDADLAPWAVYDPTPPEDKAALAATLKTAGEAIRAWDDLARTHGLEVDLDAMAETFGVPLRASTKPIEAPAAPANDNDPDTARRLTSARRFLARHRLRMAA